MFDKPLIVLNAYEVSLAASKEKEQQLQAELDTIIHTSQVKDRQILKLKEELQAEQKNSASLMEQFEQQQRELEMLEQKGKARVNFVQSDNYILARMMYNNNELSIT